MLTPAKIKNHHFDAIGRSGYKASGVDAFFEDVAQSYEQMYRENGEMFKKLNAQAEQIKQYQNDEDNIRNALITAQRMAEKITNEAQEKADAMVAEVTERTQNEHARLDVAAGEILAKTKEEAQKIIDDANAQATEIIDKATRDSKEAAINARSSMIKEEAALEMMKAEVTKFKKNLLDQYNSQLALIEGLPEFIYEKFEEAQSDAEPEQEDVAEAAEEVAQETADTVEDEPQEAVQIVDEQEETAEPEVVAVVSENVEEEAPVEAESQEVVEDIPVDTLQQMIDDGEDTDADEESYVDEDEDEDVTVIESSENIEFVIPEIDEVTDEALDKIVDNYDEEPTGTKDVMFTKPKNPRQDNNNGFNVNFENINSYSDNQKDKFDNYLDIDDDDEDEEKELNEVDGNFKNKLKGFFKK